MGQVKKYKHTFLATYKRNKKAFIRPKFHFYLGPWRKEGNLPVWRRGPIIRFGVNNYRYVGNNGIPRHEAEIWDGKEYEEDWNCATLVDSRWTEEGKKNHPILSKFVKPSYMLPIWLSFYWFNSDIMYKTKWTEDDFRYEFPGHFTVVFFGLCFSITVYVPKENEKDWTCQDDYWESMLTYEYYKGDLKKTNDVMGWYNHPGEEGFRFRFQPRFLKNTVDRDDLEAIQSKQLPEIIKKYKEEEKERKEKECWAIYAEVSNENGTFDSWYKVTYKRKVLAYTSKEACQKALDNLNKKVERTKQNVLKNIEYKMFIGNKEEFIKWNSLPLLIDEVIDKEVNMFENICKLI